MTPSDRIEQIRQWALNGGGGFEGTPKASTFTFEGMVWMVEAYNSDLLSQLDRMREALEKYRHVSVADGDKAAFNYAEELLTSLQKGG